MMCALLGDCLKRWQSWFGLITAQIRLKSTTCILWFCIISRDLNTLLSNLLCLLSNSFGCYVMGLVSQSSYLFCLLSVAYYSEVMCLLSALSPVMTLSAAHLCSSSSHGNSSNYGAFLQQMLLLCDVPVLVTC